jgi:peroxiredoxin
MSKLMPRKPAPGLEVVTVAGRRWNLADAKPQHSTLIVFYRGLHCPLCKGYLGELNRLAAEFNSRGVEVFALSSDDQERAQRTQDEWGLTNLDLGYALRIDTAREWGLYVSAGRGKTSMGVEEPALFSEPGVFLVRPDQTLYWAAVQTMPFARPHFRDMLGAIDFVIKNDYLARGES